MNGCRILVGCHLVFESQFILSINNNNTFIYIAPYPAGCSWRLTTQYIIVVNQWTTRASGLKRLRFSGLSWVVTVTFQNIAACKLLFFVKNKGQWNAKSGPKVGDGKVAM